MGEGYFSFHHNCINTGIHKTKDLSVFFSRPQCVLPWCGVYSQALS